MKTTKFLYYVVIQGKYSEYYGYEDLCQYPDTKEGRRDARVDFREYRIDEREYQHRIIHRRERNPAYSE